MVLVLGDYHVLSTYLVVADEARRLGLRILDLQLMNFAQQTQDLSLVFINDFLRKYLEQQNYITLYCSRQMEVCKLLDQMTSNEYNDMKFCKYVLT